MILVKIHGNGNSEVIECSKCNGSGLVRGHELDNYDVHRLYGIIDDTPYTCDWCNGGWGYGKKRIRNSSSKRVVKYRNNAE